jgi:hypothetical protein
MPRFYLRLILLPILFFTVILLLIHTQPYDDRELRELLLPNGCPAPCFMGIRPGVTTRDEAMRLLKASDWVEMDTAEVIDGIQGPTLGFRWSGKQPDLISEWFGLTLVFQNAAPNTITKISFQIQYEMQLGTLNLALGRPSVYGGYLILGKNFGMGQNAFAFDHYYDAHHIDLYTISGCPIRLVDLLKTKMVTINYYDTLPVGVMEPNLKNILRIPDCQ